MSSGGPVAIETLLALREWVRGLSRRLVLDDAAADDLEQQAWVDALRSPPARDEGLRGWFATLLRRRARDAWRAGDRRERREAAAARPEGVRSTADVVAEAEAHRRVVEAVMSLEEPYRETILLRFFEDLPPRDVAARQGVPVETVRTRTRRALERLREGLDRGSGGVRADWMGALMPLAGLRIETGVAAGAAGGAIVGTKAAIVVGVLGAAAGAVSVGIATSGGPTPAALDEARAEARSLRTKLGEREAGSAPAPSAPSAAVEERLASQEARIRDLETQLAEARRQAEAARQALPARPSSEDRDDVRDAKKEQEKGAAMGWLMKRQEAETVRKAEATAAATRAEEARALFELRRTVLDTSLPEADRAAALSKLRGIKGGIDREVVFAVIDLFRISRSLVVREGILRDVHGTRDPDLKQLFLDTLTRDPEATLRERAARDIDDYLDDPAVRQALESARDGDASETVRRAAERTLQPRSREKK